MYTQLLCARGWAAVGRGFVWVAIGLLAGCSNTSTTTPMEPVETPMASPEVAAPMPVPAIDLGALQHTFYFDFNAAVLSVEARSALRKHALWVQENHDQILVVEGHADERGSREYNLALGQSRADVVRAFLIVHGVPDGLIDVVSYGEERPAKSSHTERSWSQNRRAFVRHAAAPELAKQ